MTSLFTPRPAQQGKPTYDELRRMRADMDGFHYRHAESMALLARLGPLDIVRVERLDGGHWSFAWNGTPHRISTPAHTRWTAPPVDLDPRHCVTFLHGLPYGLWSDSAGWQWEEARWLAALAAHVTARELEKPHG